MRKSRSLLRGLRLPSSVGTEHLLPPDLVVVIEQHEQVTPLNGEERPACTHYGQKLVNLRDEAMCAGGLHLQLLHQQLSYLPEVA